MFRLSSRADPAFLAEMLYEAVNWRDDGAEERPPLDEMLDDPSCARYVEDWGRMGDGAIVALDRLDEPVGAAWYRCSAEEPGYGFVAADVPELSIAVYPECRGQHVGSLLLGTLVSRARADGYRAISLSVAVENPARRPVRAARFRGVAENGDAITMVLELNPSADLISGPEARHGPSGNLPRSAERMQRCRRSSLRIRERRGDHERAQERQH